jgi:ribonuclease HII
MPEPLSLRQQEGLAKIRFASQQYIIGVDEVGLGAWAGPLYVVAVAMPRDWQNPLVKDSKKMSAAARNAAVPIILKDARVYAIVSAESDAIDRFGVKATLESLVIQAITICRNACGDSIVVLDGDVGPDDASLVFPKADALVPAVSAASVLAKTTRDRVMRELGLKYPGYGFDRHVGYGTQFHTDAITKLGICAIHRRSYAPIKRVVVNGGG